MPELPLIVHYLQRDDFGGGPKAMLNVAQALEGLGRQIVLTSGHGKIAELLPNYPTLELLRLQEVPNALFPWTVVELALTLRRLKPAVIITHGQWGGFIVGLARSLFGASMPAIYVCHWCSLYAGTDAYRAARNYWIEKVTLQAHERIVCLSEGNARQFTLAGLLDDRARLRIIPNSVSPIAPSTTKPKDAPSGLYFVFLGRLEEQKRPDWLLKAWRIALDQGLKNARLLVLGEGEWRSRLEQQRRVLQLENTVELCGYRSDAQQLLQHSGGLLMTSLFEGHANVVLEALACGVPVLTMATDGVQESVTDGSEGFVVPLGDVQTFAERIITLSGDEDLRRAMGAKGILRARQYDPSIQREAYRNLVTDVLRGKPV